MVKIKPSSVRSVQLLFRRDVQRQHQDEQTVGTSTPLEFETPFHSETPWQQSPSSRRQSTGPVTRLDVSDGIGSQELPPFPTNRAEQPRGVSFTQPNIEWDDLLDGEAHAAMRDDLSALIAGTRNPYSLREWSKLDPLDRSSLSVFRQSAAVGLARMAGECLDEDHPLLPDVMNAARNLFEHGILHNSRVDRMMAAEIIVNASPFLPNGSNPAYGAASALREFVETQAKRLEGSEMATPQETVFSMAARMKPRPTMITAKLIGIMRERVLQRSAERVAVATKETLAYMHAYESLIPRFKPGHTEIMAGILMCGMLIDESSVHELTWTAYEIQGQLADLQTSANVADFRITKIRPM